MEGKKKVGEGEGRPALGQGTQGHNDDQQYVGGVRVAQGPAPGAVRRLKNKNQKKNGGEEGSTRVGGRLRHRLPCWGALQPTQLWPSLLPSALHCSLLGGLVLCCAGRRPSASHWKFPKTGGSPVHGLGKGVEKAPIGCWAAPGLSRKLPPTPRARGPGYKCSPNKNIKKC